MTNKEKYKEQIIDAVVNQNIREIGVNMYTMEIQSCADLDCEECVIDSLESGFYSCDEKYKEWLEKDANAYCEFTEADKADEEDRCIAKLIYDNGYRYIARNRNGSLYSYRISPKHMHKESWTSGFNNDIPFKIDEKYFKMVKPMGKVLYIGNILE